MVYRFTDPHADHAAFDADRERDEAASEARDNEINAHIDDICDDLRKFGLAKMPKWIDPKKYRHSVLDYVDRLDEEFLAKYMTETFDCYCSNGAEKIAAYDKLIAASINHIKVNLISKSYRIGRF